MNFPLNILRPSFTNSPARASGRGLIPPRERLPMFYDSYSREDWKRLGILACCIAVLAIILFLFTDTGPGRCEQLEDIGRQARDIRREIERFHDGQTDWREVVNNLEESTAALEYYVNECRCRERSP